MEHRIKLYSRSEEESQEVAKNILAACNDHKIFAIYGDLGAGKTTLVKAICKLLDVEDTVKSPTFSIVNEYEHPEGKIYHFDFYRIKNLNEAYDLGYEEYFDSGHYCFIEWPEMIESLLPLSVSRIRIQARGATEREFTLTTNPK